VHELLYVRGTLVLSLRAGLTRERSVPTEVNRPIALGASSSPNTFSATPVPHN